jgi:hypothetical protein
VPHSCLTTASLLPHCCLTAASQLPHNCLTTASLLPHCCLTTASLLPHNCLTTASLLPHCCLTAASLLPHYCLTTASQVARAGSEGVRTKVGVGCGGLASSHLTRTRTLTLSLSFYIFLSCTCMRPLTPKHSLSHPQSGAWAADAGEAAYIEGLVDADEKWDTLMEGRQEWVNRPVQPPGLGRSGVMELAVSMVEMRRRKQAAAAH